MTAREEALELLRERFPEPWTLSLRQAPGCSDRWYADADLRYESKPQDAAFVHGFGTNPHGAARACIAAWDEATKVLDGMAFRRKWMAERALADRLAEALAAIIGVADLDAALEDTDASENDAESKGLRAIAAWRAARGKA